jgi:hypothetical protein
MLTAPIPRLTQSPVKELHKFEVVVVLIVPDRIFVTTIQDVNPVTRLMIGETITANVDVLSHDRMHTIGSAPPPSKQPSILTNQFRDIPTEWKIHEIAASKVP